MSRYYTPQGGLPPQTQITHSRAVFTEAYAVMPKGVMTDIVTSSLPHWTKTRVWILARPMTGFVETFSHYIMELAPAGGSQTPEPSDGVQAVLFVTDGTVELTIAGENHQLVAGSYAYIPAGLDWKIVNQSNTKASFHWIRKRWRAVEGIGQPEAFVTHEDNHAPDAMPETDGCWSTTRFVEPDDLRHDMHVNIVNFEPGGVIPFPETHVMEHGLYVLEGKAVYLLNQDWVEVEAGDYMLLRAFCPQACYAAGPGRFRYLLYKDVNRHVDL